MERSAISNESSDYRALETHEGYESLAQKNEDGFYELSVLVSGVHCAGCIQKIEGTLNQQDEIEHVRLNFSTGRLAMSWNGAPEIANDYIQHIEKLGYGVQPYDAKAARNEVEKEERFLLLCLGAAGFAMGNVMLISVGLWSTSVETMGMATRDFMHIISALIALPAILFAGRPFFRSAFGALRAGHANMDVPISLALILASGMSLIETINSGEHVYFDSALMLMFFLLVGRYLDFRARKNARSAATDLLNTLSGFAHVVEGKQTKRVLIRDLIEGMTVRVAAGEKLPVDGVLVQGETEVDTSLVTGETLPVAIKVGAEVYAGTLNLSAPVTIKVSKPAEDSLLADIVRLMERAGQGQAEYVRLADRAARLYTPAVHTLALLAFCGWFFVGGLDWQGAMMIAITVLIITCPCALGLAVPVVQVLATGKLMKCGVLVKSGDALERLAAIDTVMLDKTGTLTLGQPALVGDYKKTDFKLAASLASHSGHVLSRALLNAYDGELHSITKIKDHPGKGVSGEYKGQIIKLGSRSWCGDEKAKKSDKSEIWLGIKGRAPVRLSLEDTLRRDAAQMIKDLHDHKLQTLIVSGDRAEPVRAVAKACGIQKYFAEQTPPEKFKIMEGLQSEGRKVLMVGDGLNDAPVLAGANVSMAPGTAIDMAQNAADIVFMGDELSPVYKAWQTARRSQSLIKQNFALAVLYNVIAIPLALFGMVTPLIAAIAMSGSSLIVIANSFRLKLKS